jgi:hypothetical protein
MKVLFYLLLVSGVVLVCFGKSGESRWDVRAEETIQRTLRLSGAPMRLIVDNLDGPIHVTGTSGDEVRLIAHKTIRAETQSDLEQAKNEVKLTTTEKPGSVEIYYDAPWRCYDGNVGCHESHHRRFYEVSFDIEVQAPAAARLVVSAVNGKIRVDGASGDFDVNSVNGGITMAAISGSGDVHTVNGPVRVQFASNPRRPSSFKTVNGPIDLYFRPDLSADLRLKTFNGELFSDFDVKAAPIEAASVEHQSGRYVYQSNRTRAGRIGRGGPELQFETLNGSVRLHRGDAGNDLHE